MYSNRFTHLANDNYNDNNDTSNTNIVKKALKKLREIQALEHKDNLSPQELDKIAGKHMWERMVPSLNSTSNENPQVKIKTKTKEKREKEKRLKMEREQRTREKKEQAERLERKKKEQAERLERMKKEEEKRIKREELKEKYKKTKANTITELDEEWIFTLCNIYDNDTCKTFRFLSKKYHPDKNINNQNQELQKRLVYLRDFYD